MSGERSHERGSEPETENTGASRISCANGIFQAFGIPGRKGRHRHKKNGEGSPSPPLNNMETPETNSSNVESSTDSADDSSATLNSSESADGGSTILKMQDTLVQVPSPMIDLTEIAIQKDFQGNADPVKISYKQVPKENRRESNFHHNHLMAGKTVSTPVLDDKICSSKKICKEIPDLVNARSKGTMGNREKLERAKTLKTDKVSTVNRRSRFSINLDILSTKSCRSLEIHPASHRHSSDSILPYLEKLGCQNALSANVQDNKPNLVARLMGLDEMPKLRRSMSESGFRPDSLVYKFCEEDGNFSAAGNPGINDVEKSSSSASKEAVSTKLLDSDKNRRLNTTNGKAAVKDFGKMKSVEKTMKKVLWESDSRIKGKAASHMKSTNNNSGITSNISKKTSSTNKSASSRRGNNKSLVESNVAVDYAKIERIIKEHQPKMQKSPTQIATLNDASAECKLLKYPTLRRGKLKQEFNVTSEISRSSGSVQETRQKTRPYLAKNLQSNQDIGKAQKYYVGYKFQSEETPQPYTARASRMSTSAVMKVKNGSKQSISSRPCKQGKSESEVEVLTSVSVTGSSKTKMMEYSRNSEQMREPKESACKNDAFHFPEGVQLRNKNSLGKLLETPTFDSSVSMIEKHCWNISENGESYDSTDKCKEVLCIIEPNKNNIDFISKEDEMDKKLESDIENASMVNKMTTRSICSEDSFTSEASITGGFSDLDQTNQETSEFNLDELLRHLTNKIQQPQIKGANNLLNDEESMHWYVTMVLEQSGILQESEIFFYPQEYPLDGMVFVEVEEKLKTFQHEWSFSSESELINKKLLFDTVNEILYKILYPYNEKKQFMDARCLHSERPVGERLSKMVWNRIKSLPIKVNPGALVDNLVEKITENDIYKSNSTWPDNSEEIDYVVRAVEKSMVTDLLEEAFWDVRDLKNVRPMESAS